MPNGPETCVIEGMREVWECYRGELDAVEDYFRALLPDGFQTIDVAYTPDVSLFVQAVLLRAVDQNIRATQCLDEKSAHEHSDSGALPAA